MVFRCPRKDSHEKSWGPTCTGSRSNTGIKTFLTSVLGPCFLTLVTSYSLNLSSWSTCYSNLSVARWVKPYGQMDCDDWMHRSPMVRNAEDGVTTSSFILCSYLISDEIAEIDRLKAVPTKGTYDAIILDTFHPLWTLVYQLLATVYLQLQPSID